MAQTVVCPELRTLQGFVLGQLKEAEAAQVESHLLGCAFCIQTLRGLKPEDPLVQAVQAAVNLPEDPEVPPEEVERLMRKFKRPLARLPNSPDATATEATGEALTAASAEASRPSPQASPTSTDATPDYQRLLLPPQSPDEMGRLGVYRVLKVLGSGGMGVVFLAEDPHLQRLVALKVMLPGLAASGQARQRFLREARSVAALKHHHIVTIYQVGEEQGMPFLAMEFLKGETLEERLKRQEKLPLLEVLRIGREIAEALGAAHATGLIHRDIKPGNIWLEDHRSTLFPGQGEPGASATGARVKILDFGLARATSEDAGLTLQGAIIGTPAYMAPEQGRGDPVDARCDLFSLGVVLYRLCCGQQPFQGKEIVFTLMAVATHQPVPPSQLNPELPPDLSDLVMRLLEKDPAQRMASAGEVVQALQALEKKLALQSETEDPPPSAPAKPGNAAPRRRRLVFITALVLLAGLGGIGALAVIRIATDKGAYVIETDDPDFSFRVNKGKVTLEDRKTNRKYQIKVLHQDQARGEYELEVTDAGDHSFTAKTFTIKRGEKVALKAWFERKDAAAANKPAVIPDDAWIKQVAALPADKQVATVAEWLKERNPGFDGKLTHQIEGGVVTSLDVPSPLVRDLTPLRALTGLRTLTCRSTVGYDYKAESDAVLLRSLKTLEKINGKPMAQFWKDVAVKQADFKEWLQQVPALPAKKQVEEVVAKLEALNPGFDGKVTPKIEGGVVIELGFSVGNVTDLSPAPALVGLKDLGCCRGPLSDLLPLKDMKLTSLSCFETQVSDLSPLKDMKLTYLDCRGTKVSDLSPLKDMQLTQLNCQGTKVSDLSPLKNMKLTELKCRFTKVSDLSPLKNMKLTELNCGNTPVSDLSPLKDMKLTDLDLVFTQVSDLSPLKNMQLTSLGCGFTGVSDLSPLKGMKLTSLSIRQTKVLDLSPLKDMKLTYLDCGIGGVSDLSPLKDMKLTYLNCGNTPVSDLSPLKDMKLTELWCQGTNVTDLSPLQEMPLKNLTCDFKPERDAEILRSIKTLETINGKPAKEVLKDVDGKANRPLDDAWLKAVAALPADKQVAAVADWLRERNPGFDGKVTHQIEGGVVTSLDVPSPLVRDLTPLRALTGLRTLTCRSTVGYDYKAESDAALLRSLKSLEKINGKPLAQFWKDVAAKQAEFKEWLQQVPALPAKKQVEAVVAWLKELNPGFDGRVEEKIEDGVVTRLNLNTNKVADISPLRALTGLKSLNCSGTWLVGGSLADLTPLKGMPLTYLHCGYTPVSDLSPLKDMKLTELHCLYTQVSDLSPLKDMKLTFLDCQRTQVTDLSPLKDMKLTFLNCEATPVIDLTPLKDMKLTGLSFAGSGVSDLSPLKGMPLTVLNCSTTLVSDLSPLKGMPLASLACGGTKVSDLSPLKDTKLIDLKCQATQVTDLSPLKGMTLTLLWCSGTQVTDLSPLKGMPLKDFHCDFKPERDAEILRSIKTLETINGKPAKEVLK